MKILLRTLVPLFFVLAIVGSSREAHALGPVGIEVGAQVGGGTNPASYSSINALGLGIGGRAGVTLFGGLYGGVKIMDYLGGSNDSVSIHTVQYGIDAGWGFKVLILTIRPQVGVGNASFHTSIEGGASTSSSNVYVEPGVTALISLGLVYIGADINYLILPGVAGPGGTSTQGAVTIHGQLGVQF